MTRRAKAGCSRWEWRWRKPCRLLPARGMDRQAGGRIRRRQLAVARRTPVPGAASFADRRRRPPRILPGRKSAPSGRCRHRGPPPAPAQTFCSACRARYPRSASSLRPVRPPPPGSGQRRLCTARAVRLDRGQNADGRPGRRTCYGLGYRQKPKFSHPFRARQDAGCSRLPSADVGWCGLLRRRSG